VKDVLESVDRPNRRFEGLLEGVIKAGEMASVSISMVIAETDLWNAAMQYVVGPGEFVV